MIFFLFSIDTEQFFDPVNPGLIYGCNNSTNNNSSQCAIHQKQPRNPCIPPNIYYPPAAYNGIMKPYPYSIPHSRSLDQYDHNPVSISNRFEQTNAHRHSLDQPYNIPTGYQARNTLNHMPGSNLTQYDGIAHDKGGFYPTAAYNNSDMLLDYNMPRSRVPLDCNILNRFSEDVREAPSHHPHTFPNNCMMHYLDNGEINFTSGGVGHGSGGSGEKQPKQSLQGILKKDTSLSRREREMAPLTDMDYPHINKKQSSKNPDVIYGGKYSHMAGGAQDTTSSSKISLSSGFDSIDGAVEHKSNSRTSLSSSKHREGIGSYESWNYVFKNLEQQGYKKDLGGGDAEYDIENAFDGITLEEQRQREPKPSGKVTHRSRNKSANSDAEPLVLSNNTSNFINRESSVLPAKDNLKLKDWSCNFCTYLNAPSKQICEMCSKTRNYSLNHSKSNNSKATCI